MLETPDFMSKAYFLGGILLISIFLFVGILTRFVEFQGSTVNVCVDIETGARMAWSEALDRAADSECILEGTLTRERFCNQNTGTWWINLDADKPGCNPACVVDVVTGEALVNWRCTGMIP